MHRTLTRWLAVPAAALAAVAVLAVGTGSAQALPTASGAALPAGVAAPCAPAAAGHATCAGLVDTGAERQAADLPAASGLPSGLTPANLEKAYDLQSDTGGSEQTVAVVTAYDDPDAASDLATYRSAYGIPPCTAADGCFTKVNETGGTTYPTTGAGWSAADAQSMDMISAICPFCHIVLVEASSTDITDLGTAENEAVTLGAKFVDNDWMTPESGLGSDELTYDTEYFDHPGVAITAPAGNSGYGTVEYPAASQYVTAVGGTTLTASSAVRGYAETAWADTGSGCSAYEPKPSWQTDAGCSGRTLNDTAADADPSVSPVNYYDTPTTGGWGEGGGTLVSAAIVDGIYALAGTPASASYPASYPYQHPGGSYTTPGNAYPYSDGLYNITSGSTGTCSPDYLCTAGAGYNGPTGVGTPASVMSFSSSGGTSGPFFGGVKGICIDDTSNSTSNGNKIQIYNCNGDAAQQWTAESNGTVTHGGTDCLDVINGGTANGTLLQLYSCIAGDANQQWEPLSDNTLYNPQSGKCLADPSGSTTNGTQFEIYTCSNIAAEEWPMPYADPTATGPIESQITTATICLDDYNDATTSGNKIQIFTCNGDAAQDWSIEANGTLQVSGHCVATVSDGTSDGTKVALYNCTGDPNQHWVDRSDGTLVNTRSGTCLDDPSATTTNGTQLQIFTCNGDVQQSWTLP